MKSPKRTTDIFPNVLSLLRGRASWRLEAFADDGKYFLTEQGLLFYEEYANISEFVLHVFQPVKMQWQTFVRANRQLEETV